MTEIDIRSIDEADLDLVCHRCLLKHLCVFTEKISKSPNPGTDFPTTEMQGAAGASCQIQLIGL